MNTDERTKRLLLRDVLEREGYRDIPNIARLHNVPLKQAYSWLGEVRSHIMNELEQGRTSMAEARRLVPQKLLEQWTEETRMNAHAMSLAKLSEVATNNPEEMNISLEDEYVVIRVPVQTFFSLFANRGTDPGRKKS